MEPERVTDAILDDAWANLGRLHAMRIAHGGMRAENVLARADGTTAFVDFGRGIVGRACRTVHDSTPSSCWRPRP